MDSAHLRAQPSNSIDHFAARYKSARTEIEKRTVCLELIDADLLYAGANIDEIKRVFLGDFEEMGMGDRSNKLAIVHFVPPIRPKNPMASTVWTGWYLSLTYRQDGTVVHYSLSNDSKTRSMRLLYERRKSEGRADSNDTNIGMPIVELSNASPAIVNTNSTGPKK